MSAPTPPTPRPADPIADCLVLVFTMGMSVKSWRANGMLEREWALYRCLLAYYRRIVLVTYGGADDRAALDSVLTADERPHVVLVANEAGARTLDYVAQIPGRVLHAMGNLRTVLVKTNQLMGGETAVHLVDSLRTAGKEAALVARGGYLWTRFVTYEHGPHSEAADDAAGREKLLCQAADMVVGTTDDMVSDLAWRYGLNPEQTRVIPNYVLVDQEPVPASQREPGLLLYAGQLVPRKRVNILIEAVASLPDDLRGRMKLEVIGEGTEKARLQALAAQLHAPVVFEPRMPHLALLERMRRCSLYLQASDLEGHPKTVLEAMAAGTPVVVADAPGLGTVVEHGSTGLRVQASADAYATAIAELFGDEDWRELMGSAAARVVRARYGLPEILKLEIAIHRRAVEVQRSRVSARRVAG